MKGRLAIWLRLPIGFRTQRISILRFASVFALFIFLFLSFYKPFFIAQLAGDQVWTASGMIAGFTWLCIYGNHLLVLNRFESITQSWNMGMELIWSIYHFILIGLFNVVVARYYLSIDVPSWTIVGDTAFVGIIPVGLDLLNRYNRTSSPERSELLYVKSDGNYIHIYESKGETTNRTIERTPLYKFRDRNRNRLVQVHKQYLINTSAVKGVRGNSNGGHIVLCDDSHVPYSRRFYVQVRKIAS